MDFAFIYIGLAQSIYSAFLLFVKKPSQVADKILGIWLILIACMFGLNVIKLNYNITIDVWPVSVILATSFPVFLFLYTKYIVGNLQKFKLRDILFFIPVLVGIIILLIYLPSNAKNIKSLIVAYSQETKAQQIVGYIFIFSLWVYCILSLTLILAYRLSLFNYYSFQSNKINLRWLVILILTFLFSYLYIIYISQIHYQDRFIPHIEKFRSGSLLLFVFIVMIWGYRQKQLSANIWSPNLNLKLNSTEPTETQSDKYKKSGLKESQADKYMNRLVDFMNTSLIWKDKELSIVTLSQKTEIPKHYISQILNEKMDKNFYTFINEYRTEYAMKIIKLPEYQDWSIVEIAQESGFNSKTVFNTFFKKYTGMTPSEFKKKK